MGDGILDGYPIIQDQTSPNLAHIPTTNLIEYSEDFSQSYWSKINGVTVTGSTIISPIGVNNAQGLQFDGTSNGRLEKGLSGELVAGDRSLSVYVKVASGTANVSVGFSTGSNTSFTINTEWKKIKHTESSSDFPRLRCDENKLIYVWGFQAEQQSQATAYIKSDGIAAVRKSSTTNEFLYSEDFSQSYWTKNNSSVVSGFISPDGNTNAYKLVEDLSTSAHSLYRSNFSINTVRTFSVFAKKSEKERISIYDANKFGRFIGVIFNLTSGIVESNQDDSLYLNPKIELISNGWYRCSVTWQNSALQVPAFAPAILSTNVYAGDGVSGIYVYGAQFEEQTQAETYAKTTGLPVTIDLFTENNYGTMTNMSANDIVIDTPGVS